MSDDLRAAEALAALQSINTDRIEFKADVATAVLDIDNHDREVTTLFSVDNLDDGGDIAEVSAFKRSIDHRRHKIPHLFMHNTKAPAIARIMDFTPLRRAELPTDVQQAYPEATGGMACVSRYLKTGDGATVYDGIKEGIAYQASFGYRVIDAEHKTLRDGRKARVIKELMLFEVSTTHAGHAMNDATRILSKATLDALDALTEIKAGWRHGKHGDIAALRQMYQIVTELLGIPSALIEPASLALPVRTSTAIDDLLSEVSSIYNEVTLCPPMQPA